MSVEAAVDSGGDFDSPIVEVTVASDTGDLDGVTGGQAPLRAVVVALDVLNIAQGFPLADASNMISVTLLHLLHSRYRS